MNRKLFLLVALFAASMIAFQSCDRDENETKISSFTSNESHKAGENCMACHVSGGDGEGFFKVAGTVYNEQNTSVYPGATIKLYDGPNSTGTLVASIQVDENGNFYSTEDIDFSSGLYPSVVGSNSTEHMPSATTTGACNSCHGGSVDKIWVK